METTTQGFLAIVMSLILGGCVAQWPVSSEPTTGGDATAMGGVGAAWNGGMDSATPGAEWMWALAEGAA